MPRSSYLNLLLTFILLACNTSQEVVQREEPTVRDFESLMALFRQPTADYRTVPFWVWNDEVTEEKITNQLTEFKNQGINSVMIHCRPGLITEYLSDE